ncbi:MAG: helix-turn-helix domain-containing protein [Caulobacterales bacterium]|nr:helix-turn-helix domain-containing protein [Caulobacterales bacterium]
MDLLFHLIHATTRSHYGIKSVRRQILTIGRLARSAGVHLETVRYYERIGLMPAPARTEGGHRSYAPGHSQRLRFIRRSRELGFSIDAIRRLIALSEPEVQACCEVRDMAQEHIASIDAKIVDLQRLRGVLQQAVADCRDGNEIRCPVIQELGSS